MVEVLVGVWSVRPWASFPRTGSKGCGENRRSKTAARLIQEELATISLIGKAAHDRNQACPSPADISPTSGLGDQLQIDDEDSITLASFYITNHLLVHGLIKPIAAAPDLERQATNASAVDHRRRDCQRVVPNGSTGSTRDPDATAIAYGEARSAAP